MQSHLACVCKLKHQEQAKIFYVQYSDWVRLKIGCVERMQSPYRFGIVHSAFISSDFFCRNLRVKLGEVDCEK